MAAKQRSHTPDLAAAGVGAKPALGLAEVFERVATKHADERLARALDHVLGVDGFEEQTHGAILGAGALALFLDDGALAYPPAARPVCRRR